MSEPTSTTYSLYDVAIVTKQHVHDVRNVLNGMDLELTLLEIATKDAKQLETVAHLRKSVSKLSNLMQGISAKYATDEAQPTLALHIAERWNFDAIQIAGGVQLKWDIQLTKESVDVESRLIRALLIDLLEQAFKINAQGSLHINCRSEGGNVIFEITTTDKGKHLKVIDTQQTYWSAIRHLAQRNRGIIEPEVLSADCFPLRLVLPQSAASSSHII